jgi:CheY-like chemotaxis protein
MREGARGRVLVVEDEEDTRLAYRAILEQAGWEVEEAVSGDEALRLARQAPPSLMLVDISIPGLHGWETTRQVKLGSTTRGVPVLAVTGHALDDDRRRAVEVGCDGYLVKPVSAEELVSVVERLATPTGRAREATPG